ncbi:LytR/AlgR family response regulator transcription factor [Pedobacter duraquae]|uniref:LytTR family two component transcriptional regulator n=1 Tax=Pedobacter duraquae TaxID=425511 RepID=A0A4R6IBM5_9SPHI|nr:LytTR family DNA-binding domain-containing protein [Pedobacter duraquae]TDO19610.1 LytTR family two component transcriptional regulator [Pedobacter duraquae]
MKRYNCLIVDDEPIAREIIEKFCGYLPSLKVLASCGQAFEAMEILSSAKVDILFLDINMPVLDGISFLKTLKKAPQVIFTTAYKEYATDAFDLAACDYLLKPFSLERFIMAVGRAEERLKQLEKPLSIIQETSQIDHIFIKAEGKIYKLAFEKILYTEAQGNHTKIVTTDQDLLPTITFSTLQELLPSMLFLRVHRSFLVNMSKITHVEGNRIFIEEMQIPVGSLYRDRFMKALGL